MRLLPISIHCLFLFHVIPSCLFLSYSVSNILWLQLFPRERIEIRSIKTEVFG